MKYALKSTFSPDSITFINSSLAFSSSSKCPSSSLFSWLRRSIEINMLWLATYIPDTNPMVIERRRKITRYFLHSPISSLGTLFMRGFIILFFFLFSFLIFSSFPPPCIFSGRRFICYQSSSVAEILFSFMSL